MKSGDLKPVAAFLSAIENELHRDRHIFRQLPVHRYTEVVIPRPEKLTFVAQKFSRALAIAASLSDRLWLPFLYPILLLFQTIGSLRHVVAGKAGISEKQIFFANSFMSLICSKNASYRGKYLFATASLERSNPGAESLGCITDYVTGADIAAAFLNSVRAMFRINKVHRVPGAAFQIYPAFNWFLTWNVMCKIGDRLDAIWISCDSDRWAVLVDQVPMRGEKIIVQHGLLHDPSNQVGFRNPAPLPTRLRTIGKIILLDSASETSYRSHVLSEESKTKFEVSEEWLQMLAQNTPVAGDPSVLIVGTRENLEDECMFANHIAKEIAMARIYIRPHPSVGAKKYEHLLNKSVEVVGDPQSYPCTKICLCFGYSTLAYLYEKRGTKVIYLNELEGDPMPQLERILRNHTGEVI